LSDFLRQTSIVGDERGVNNRLGRFPVEARGVCTTSADDSDVADDAVVQAEYSLVSDAGELIQQVGNGGGCAMARCV
jgi:hypothetical protein